MLHACSRVAIAVCVCATAITAYSQETAHRQITDFTGLARATRPVNNTYPVSGPAHVFISTQWGTVRIVPWAEQIVRVTAEIRVGAATTAVAERIAQSVEVTGNHVGDRIEVRTKYPAIEPPAKVGFETNLEVSVPAGASVEVENTIGAILARGLKGDLVVDARFCDVELADLGGRAGVRMHGQESKLDVQDLHAGGTFELRSTEATFTRVSGSLKVDNYLGGVTLRPGLSPSRLEVSCESGPLQLYLDRAASPDLVAAAKSGKIQSDLALTSETWTHDPGAQSQSQRPTVHRSIYALRGHSGAPRGSAGRSWSLGGACGHAPQ